MFRTQLKAIGQQENAIIFKPATFTGATTGQAVMNTSQAFQTQYQPSVQGYQVPVAQAANVNWGQQSMLNTTGATQWQTLQPTTYMQSFRPAIYAQAFQPAYYGQFAQPTMGFSNVGQLSSFDPRLNVVHGVAHNILQPNVDISETNSEVVVTYDLPLVDQNNLNVSVGNDSVTIHANSQQGVFYRTVTLPTDIYPETCEASLSNDILEVRLPKASQSRRKVNINQQSAE